MPTVPWRSRAPLPGVLVVSANVRMTSGSKFCPFPAGENAHSRLRVVRGVDLHGHRGLCE